MRVVDGFSAKAAKTTAAHEAYISRNAVIGARVLKQSDSSRVNYESVKMKQKYVYLDSVNNRLIYVPDSTLNVSKPQDSSDAWLNKQGPVSDWSNQKGSSKKTEKKLNTRQKNVVIPASTSPQTEFPIILKVAIIAIIALIALFVIKKR